MSVLDTIITAFYLIAPAITPNTAAFLAGGRYPIDGGRTWRGNRVLGDGKTIDGTVIGVTVGILTAITLNAARPTIIAVTGTQLPHFPLAAVLLLPAGALLGDMAASFFKRQAGLSRGQPAPVLDQLDYAVLALGLTFLAVPAWFLETITLSMLAVIVLIVPFLRLSFNMAMYRAGIKDEPW